MDLFILKKERLLDENSKEPKALVFFHGWGFDHRIWSPFLPYLEAEEREYTYYLVDLPGFGQSASMNWETFKSKLFEQLPANVALLGWSMGGLVAQRLAIELPEKISFVLNICTSPHFIEDNEWPGIKLRTFEHFLLRLQKNPQKVLREFIELHTFRPNASQAPQDDPCLNARKLDFQPSHDALTEGLSLLKNWDFRESIKALKGFPVSYCFGYYDSIVPKSLMTVMQRIYPSFSYHLFSKAGHIPFLSQPVEMAAFIHAQCVAMKDSR